MPHFKLQRFFMNKSMQQFMKEWFYKNSMQLFIQTWFYEAFNAIIYITSYKGFYEQLNDLCKMVV